MLKQYVIAIGGPLGSLKPLCEFFDHTPLDNASYIILQHLPEGHRSVMDEVLRRHSKLRVVEAAEGASIEIDRVYFAPPFHNLMIYDGTLRLEKRTLRINPSFDIFMESLAGNENKRHAIAVIFSGLGRDGIKGVEAIRKAGGLVLVQAPESCEFPELPRKIIQSGNADYVVLPQDMPAIIQGYINRPAYHTESL